MIKKNKKVTRQRVSYCAVKEMMPQAALMETPQLGSLYLLTLNSKVDKLIVDQWSSGHPSGKTQ